MAKLSDSEIRSLLDDEIRQAVGYDSSELSGQRKKALEYYYGEPFGNELEGRSSYVSRDVADTIEWIMPSIMRIFAGSDNVVKFEPQGPEDEQAAKQATDYVNYVFQRQNDGFLTLYTWFKDALLAKNGFVKVYWDKYSTYKSETYENLTDDEFAYLMQEPSVEALEHSEFENPDGTRTHAIKIRRKAEEGKCCVVPVPPEEVLVNRYPVNPLRKNRFVAHRRRVLISELKEMGFENVDDLSGFEEADFNTERIARYAFDETDSGEASGDPSRKYVWLAECYTKLDVDGDGIPELRKITMAADRILENEESDTIPFVSITPIMLPHKLYGMSIADLVMDLQLLKSQVFRQILDNMYLANNGRYMALDGMVNIDDLLVNRPGGIVRVKTFDAVKPMQPPLLGAPAFNLLEYIDTIKENRTGVTRYNQGIDANSLNKTASGINQIMSASQQRVELIARVFAETGVKDLFYAILENVQKHEKQSKIVRLRNEWVTVDPREWTSRFDLSVSVGLGTGSKEAQLQAVQTVIQLQMTALQGGIPIVQPENFYHSAMTLMQAANLKGGEMFFTHPQKMPPQQPQPDPKMMELQMKQQMSQQDMQMNQQRTQAKAQQEAMTHRDKMAMEAERLRMEAAKIQAEIQLKQAELAAEIELERQKATAELQLKASETQANMEMEKQKLALSPDGDVSNIATAIQHYVSQARESEASRHKSAAEERVKAIVDEMMNGMQALVSEVRKPRRRVPVRDDKGKIIEVREIDA
jgi:hypothetical protein